MERSVVKRKILAAFFLICVFASWLFMQTRLNSFDQTRSQYQSSELNVYYQDGSEWTSVRSDLKSRKSEWLALERISKSTVEAVLLSEDQNFYRHFGVDVFALAASLWQRLKYSSPRGGSTISMQLVKLLRPEISWQGYLGKIKQVLFSLKLEIQWSKAEILEAYFNLVPLRGEYRGISAAAKMFKLNVANWDQIDSLIFAAQLRSPNAEWARISERACLLAEKKSLPRQDCLKIQSRVEFLSKSPLSQPDTSVHFADYLNLKKIKGSYQSAVIKDLQAYAESALEDQLQKLSQKNVHDAAVLVLENSSGKVLAYVGGSKFSAQKYVDGVQALRQAGSTLKPFLYSLAIEKNILRPDSWLDDSPLDVNLGSGSYRPRNHDKNYSGWVRAAYALGSSLNIPAIRSIHLLGYEVLWSALKEMNFRNLQLADHYGAGLALGVVDVSLWDLTNAYRTLANQGRYSKFNLQQNSDLSDLKQVFDPKAVGQVSAILSTPEFRKLTFGIYSDLNLPFWSAVKTGTSKDMRDNWCLGYSKDFTVGVWVGNFDGQPMWDVLGTTGAAPIWRDVMMFLNQKIKAQQKPETIPNLEMENQRANYPVAKISYPSDGLIFAVDPAIPKANQMIPLQANNPSKEKIFWKVDGKLFEEQYLPVMRGRHLLQLFSKQGTEIDRVSIVVK